MDFKILDFIQNNFKTPFGDVFMPFISCLGNSGAIWILITLVLLCFKKYRKDGIATAVSLLFSLLICNILLKNIVARPRPFSINTSINLLIVPPHDYSFPSGHTCAAFSVASALFMTSVKRLHIPVIILAIMISFSRLYLYVHFPTDVIGGIFAGVLCGICAVKITDKVGFLKNMKYSKEQTKDAGAL